MSHVSTVLLTHSLSEDYHETPEGRDVYPIHDQLNTFFSHAGGFREIEGERFGGTKYPHAILLAGAFNYLDWDGFIAHLRTLPWEFPESVQVMLLRDEAELFEFAEWRTA